MHAGINYRLKEVFLWTRRDLFKFFLIALIPVLVYDLLKWSWLTVPWLPIASVGTAVAFLIGFKNNASYDRLWEARKIWGAIVNASRSWGIMSLDFVTNDHALHVASEEELHAIRRRLIFRHLAWLTALRYQLRQARTWESTTHNASNKEYRKFYQVSEHSTELKEELRHFMNDDELALIENKTNYATQIIRNQSLELKELKQKGFIEDFRHMEMQNMLVEIYAQQGKSERIKNFPYPRQYATINRYFIWLFIFLVPFGMMKEFEQLGTHFVWLTVPFSMAVSWVFHTMDRLGEASENPFEGSPNDVPITALSRTIEIDLKEMLNETDIPEPLFAVNNILM